ncbi:hypothetical protein TNCV_4272191 [Trichonephila clavipes]|nr:hypothetical protein TNCV_4272191 [Trichonephila clavipes]
MVTTAGVSWFRVLVALKPRHVEVLMHIKPVEVWFDVVWKFGKVVPAQVSSSSLDRGLKLRSPSPIAFVLLNETHYLCFEEDTTQW